MITNRSLSSKNAERLWLFPCVLALASCTGLVEGEKKGDTGSLAANGGPTSTTGPTTTIGGGGGGGAVAGGGAPGTADGAPACAATTPVTPRAPLRRLTQFEYNNTLSDLNLDTTDLAQNLPAEDLSNGFGNDADSQSPSSELIKKYESIAETAAAQATSGAKFATTLPCSVNVTAATEVTCARSFVESFGPKALRRPLQAGESDSFMSLFQTVRAGSGSTFATSVAAIIEAIVQDPSFIYRLEFGVPVAGRTDVLRPTGSEMAARLSYMLWGTTPDDSLRAAAASGGLDTPEGVATQAAVMVADPRAKNQVRYFFDNLLPIASLNSLTRTTFPAYTSKLGALMRQETETFLEHLVFDGQGGSWASAFTANYTYVNAQLATFYGIQGVVGDQFQKVNVDPVKRLGLLSQAGVVAGTIHSEETNPVVRGGFVVRKLLCQAIPLPTGAIGAMVVVPAADANKTARQRYSAHSSNPVCHVCHTNMDPVGFAFENYDPIGQWRDQENGITIDATGTSPALGTFKGPAELGQLMSQSPDVQQCFATSWVNYGYGRTVTSNDSDACAVSSVQAKFKDAGYNVQKLLLALTQSDTFLYLPAVRE